MIIDGQWVDGRTAENAALDCGFVYFAYTPWPEGLAIKIGHSINPWKRVTEVTHKSYPTTLICHVKGDRAQEAALHEMFKNVHFYREWFNPSRKLYRLIDYCLKHGDLPALVKEHGLAHKELIRAKRINGDAMRNASVFFNDCHASGRRWDSGPFEVGRHRPDPHDDAWIIELAAKHGGHAHD